VLAGAALALPAGPTRPNRPAPTPAPAERAEASRHPLRFYEPGAFARAWAAVNERPPRPLPPSARVLIVPHHWLAGELILRPLRDLAATRRVTRLVLAGPDHRNAGAGPVTTSALAWGTPFGTVRAEGRWVEALVGVGLARAEPQLLTDEHSVAGLVPALARALPGAAVVPLVLRGDADAGRVHDLAAALAARMRDDPAAVLVASVDFAHDVPVAAVPRLNGESRAALAALDERRVLGWGNDHLDAPEVVALAIGVARRLGATHFELLADAHAADFGASAALPVTSYVSGYYR
jgi:AmmeMemoRadiSam system protein B